MLIDIVFLIVTGFVAWHGLSFRDAEGRPDFVRMLFGAIALIFFVRVLAADVLGVWG